jgi:hypothetical protein
MYASQRITPENVQFHVRDWLEDFSLTTQKISDDPECNFAYVITVENKQVSVGETKEHSRYLVITAIAPLTWAKPMLEKQPQEKAFQFWTTISDKLFIAKQRCVVYDVHFTIKILKWLPITNDLTQGMLFDAIEDVGGGLALAGNAANLAAIDMGFSPPMPAIPPAPTPGKGASPP